MLLRYSIIMCELLYFFLTRINVRVSYLTIDECKITTQESENTKK